MQPATDRYLNGMMNMQEQSQFAAQLAADPTLRAMLEAEQLIRATVRNDLAAFPAEHALTRSRVMESLATVKAPAAGVAAGGAAWYASGGLLKGLLGIITVAGLSIGGYFWMESNNTEKSEPISAPVSASPQPLALPETSSVATSTADSAETIHIAPEAEKPATAITVTEASRPQPQANRGKREVPTSNSSDAMKSNDASRTQAEATSGTETPQATTRPPAGARQLRVVNKDSVKLKVQVKVK